MLAFVKGNNLMEQTAYGIRNVKTCNGKLEQLDSVKMTISLKKAWQRYREEFAPKLEDREDQRNDYDPEQDEGEKRFFIPLNSCSTYLLCSNYEFYRVIVH